MSEYMFFQGNPSGKAKDAPSELSTLSVLCELLGKVDALEQRISDVNDAALYDRSQLEERIDVLESRIAKLENDQMLTMQTSPKKMPLPIAISYLEGMAYVAQRRVRELDALEQCIEKMERKLNHKGVEQ